MNMVKYLNKIYSINDFLTKNLLFSLDKKVGFQAEASLINLFI